MNPKIRIINQIITEALLFNLKNPEPEIKISLYNYAEEGITENVMVISTKEEEGYIWFYKKINRTSVSELKKVLVEVKRYIRRREA